MSSLKKPKKVKCIIAFFSQDEKILSITKEILEKKFGKIDFESEIINFIETDYYEKELGKGLLMKFISFEKLVERDSLPEIKKFSVKTENRLSTSNNGKVSRKVNIDPGLLSMENFILATGKPYLHRIYLNNGVWADLTLIFEKGSFSKLPWTYPNYSSDKIINILNSMRNIYHNQIK